MLCLIAGNYQEAYTYARAHFLEESEWFFPVSEADLKLRRSYHVLIVGTAGMNVPPSYFNRLLETAKNYGRIDRS